MKDRVFVAQDQSPHQMLESQCEGQHMKEFPSEMREIQIKEPTDVGSHPTHC